MFCVIQEIENKKVLFHPTRKGIEVTIGTWSVVGGPTNTYYGYTYSTERFIRPIKKAYKISIHQSRRENGKILKKQISICTMSYYHLLDSWAGDCIRTDLLKEKVKELGITEEELWDMVYEKLDPIIKKAKEEYQQTEEYQAAQEQRNIIDKYQTAKTEFEEKYGERTYDYICDVFGVLRNETYFKELKANYEAQQKYKSSYREKDYSNYSYKSSSYFDLNRSTYTKEEKLMAEELISLGYKALAKRLHPDVSGKENATDLFQQLGNLKEKLLKSI